MKKLLLKQKIILILTFACLFCIISVGVLVHWYINKTLISNKKADIIINSQEQVHETTLTFENNKLFSYMLTTRTKVQDFLTSPTEAKKLELTDIFTTYTNKDKKYLAIYLLDINGIGLVSTDPRFVGQDYSFRDYFKKAINGGSGIDVAIGKTSNQFGYYFSNPVLDNNGKVSGIIVVKVDASDIDNPILTSEIAKNNIIMFVDQFGVVLSSNDNSRKLKSMGPLVQFEKDEIIKNDKFLGVEIPALQYDAVEKNIRSYVSPVVVDFKDSKDRDDELLSIVKLNNDLPFYLITEIRLSTVTAQVYSTVLTILLLIIIILIIGAIFLFYTFLNFIKPIEKFKKYFNSISNGNFDQDLSIETGDEFGDMAVRVQKMSKDLSDLYQNQDRKLKEQTKQITEKVKESEEQNKAILNILEDIKIEKDKVELMAQDLEKFKLAVDNASDQVVITDNEGIVIYCNKALIRITGYKPEEALGKKAGALWKAPMPNNYYESMWDLIKNKKEVFVGEIQNKRKNGTYYTAKISISPVLDDENNVIYYVSIEHDITKEKEIDKAKTEFVSLASHQLRTPLSAINWYTEMLLSGDAGVINDEQKKYLEEVAIGNKRMIDLVEDLLNVSRLDMGTFNIDTKSINILDLIRNVINEIKPQILEKKILIEESHDEKISMFDADEKLVRMIIQNLLSNAIKYTPPYGKVKLNLVKINKGEVFGERLIDDESLAFSISDSGMGIPESQQDKIFTKLFRADNAKESETEGTGLGLYVIKSIVDQSGGQVWFKSKENEGTTFFIVFPISGMKMKDKDLI